MGYIFKEMFRMDVKKKFYDSNCNIFKEKNNLKVCKVILIVYCIVLDYIILKFFKNII